MSKKLEREPAGALEENKLVQIKLKDSKDVWYGWIKSTARILESPYNIYEFERLLNHEEYRRNESKANTVPHKLLSFWIEDIIALE